MMYNIILNPNENTKPASCLSGNEIVSKAGGLRFKSRAGQTGHSFANGSTPLRHFFETSCVAHSCNDADGPRKS